jgi:hypothetical protein
VLTGTTDSHEVARMLSDFFVQEDNRISYQNALAMEEEGELVGVAIFYDAGVDQRVSLNRQNVGNRRDGHGYRRING